LPQGELCRVQAQEVEGELAQDSEVLAGMILPGAVCVLAQNDIEHPVQLVLDRPATARDTQKLLCGEGDREQVVADRELRRAAAQLSARGDASDGCNAGKVLAETEPFVGNDAGRTAFAPPMGAGFELGRRTARSASCKALLDCPEQSA